METSGVRYLKSNAAEREDKLMLREDVIERFSSLIGSPTIVTFPGANWLTEKAIIERRQIKNLPQAKFICFENDPTIFQECCKNLPGGYHNRWKAEIDIYPDDFATLNFGFKVDAAWIDFVGQITDKRIAALQKLWHKLNHTLIVTSLMARYHEPLKSRIKESSLERILVDSLPKSKIAMGPVKYKTLRAWMHHVVLEKQNGNLEESVQSSNDCDSNSFHANTSGQLN